MKFGLFLVVLAVAGCAFAEEECCSAEDRREISYIWEKLWASAFTDRKVAITRAIFNDLFEHYPTAKSLFERVKVNEPDSGDFRAHLVRLATGLDTVINLFDDTAVLENHLAHLADQHIQRKGVTKEYFKGFSDSLARVLPQVLSCFNIEAWNRCFHKVADRISRDLP